VLEGRIERNRTRSRPKLGMLDGLMEGDAYSLIMRRAMDRSKWRSSLPRICH